MQPVGLTVNYNQVIRERLQTTASETLPLFMGVFSSDKGIEDVTVLAGQDFFKMFGSVADYDKYGQPLLQLHNIINAGGRVMAKRIVAEDATLANIIVSVTVTDEETQKTDVDGNLLYYDVDGNETVEVTPNPVMLHTAVLKTNTHTVEGIKTYAEMIAQFPVLAGADTFPLFGIADNGRGVSVKKLRVYPNYETSKTANYTMYHLQDIEDGVGSSVESTRFSIDPSATYVINQVSYSMNLIETSSTQFKSAMYNQGISDYVAKLAEITGYTTEILMQSDILFGKTIKGELLQGVRVDDTGVDISNVFGVDLESGTNGTIGDAPFANHMANPEWTAEALKFFHGEATDEIYDLDLYKIDFILDANYPVEIKNAIVELNSWRKDAMVFRDLGLNVNTYADAFAIVTPDTWLKSAFVADYLTSYDIIDPYSKKQVPVTIMYSLGPRLVNYYSNNISAPLAGIFNGFTITDAIANTLNYAPRLTRVADYRSLLRDAKINYANYNTIGGPLIVESLYTNAEIGPFQWVSNVIATQIVVKAIRRYMPQVRFMTSLENGFSGTAKLISDNVLSSYKRYFNSLNLVYIGDPEMIEQKTLDVALQCYYKNFEESEILNVYAIEGSPSDDNANYKENIYPVV